MRRFFITLWAICVAATMLARILPRDVQPYRLSGHRYIRTSGLNLYDFPARPYNPATANFWGPDSNSEAYPHLSPWLYCAANPINIIDPSGNILKGIRKQDATMIVDALKLIFNAEKFNKLNELFVADGKKINKIDPETLNNAINGMGISMEERYLIDIVAEVINSPRTCYVEFANENDIMSRKSQFALSMTIENACKKGVNGLTYPAYECAVRNRRGIPVAYVSALGGSGISEKYGKDALSLIVTTDLNINQSNAIDFGHEVFGHSRLFLNGITDLSFHHIQAIRTENLIRRVMGVGSERDGSNHMEKTVIEGFSELPQ